MFVNVLTCKNLATMISSTCPMLSAKTATTKEMAMKSALETESRTIQLYRSVKELPASWDALHDNLLLKTSYLTAIENCPPKGGQFIYLLFYKKNTPCGLALGQILQYNAYESIKNSAEFEAEQLSRGTKLKKYFAKRLNLKGLIFGNLLMTGETGFYFDENQVTKEEIFQLIDEGIKQTRKALRKEGIKISITLVKDFTENFKTAAQPLTQAQYAEISVNPNMVVNLKPEWKTFNDYLGAFKSKHRMRAKRAFKKAKHLEKKELSLAEIKQHQATIFELYDQVARNAGFNGVELQPHYFHELKANLKEHFKLIGYYLEGQLVGFYTLFLEGKRLESHYIGFDAPTNRSKQLYLNMLFDMVRNGIYHQVEQIVLARTAMTIKSSIGAVPQQLYLYLKHHNPIINHFTKSIFDYLNPPVKWEQRQPFKNG